MRHFSKHKSRGTFGFVRPSAQHWIFDTHKTRTWNRLRSSIIPCSESTPFHDLFSKGTILAAILRWINNGDLLRNESKRGWQCTMY